MRILLPLLLLSSLSFGQEKEIIKIEVSKECKEHIVKRTYIDEIFTKPVKVVSGVYVKAQMGFVYQENFIFENKGSMIYLYLDQDLFGWYETKNIYFTLDDKEYNLNLLIDFQVREGLNALMEPVKTYSLGFVLSDDMKNSIRDAKEMSIGLIKTSTKRRKVWEFSEKLVGDVKASFGCFEDYSNPIDERLTAERIKKEEEYQKNLKEFQTHFRESNWKDSKETVQNSEEDEPLLIKDDAIAYQVKLNNDDYHAYFYFNDNRLYQGVYVFKEEYVNENNFYSKYKEVQSILNGKYGEPKKVSKHRSGDLWDGANEIGMAIQTGQYREYTVWETMNSKIMLIIEGENFDSKLTIRYNSKDPELLFQVEKENKKERTKGF